MNTQPLTPAQFCALVRQYAIKRDDENHVMREVAFRIFREETVIEAAVARWVAAIGALV